LEFIFKQFEVGKQGGNFTRKLAKQEEKKIRKGDYRDVFLYLPSLSAPDLARHERNEAKGLIQSIAIQSFYNLVFSLLFTTQAEHQSDILLAIIVST